MTPTEITLGLNFVWAGASALIVLGAMLALFNNSISDVAKLVAGGALVAAMGAFIHRMWWNVGILTATNGESYAQWAIDLRAILVLPVAAIAVGVTFALKPFVETHVPSKDAWYAGCFFYFVTLFMTGVALGQ